MVIRYVPALGVVSALLTVVACFALPPPHPTPSATTTSKIATPNTCLERLPAPDPITNTNPNAGNTAHPNGFRSCPDVVDAAMMVKTVEAPLAPGTRLAFEKLHCRLEGRFPHESATGA